MSVRAGSAAGSTGGLTHLQVVRREQEAVQPSAVQRNRRRTHAHTQRGRQAIAKLKNSRQRGGTAAHGAGHGNCQWGGTSRDGNSGRDNEG